jgi:hypothetical protein
MEEMMLKENRRFAVRLAALMSLMIAAVVVTGCPGTQQVMQTGTVNLQITDGPFPFDLIDKATVTLTKIEVRKASASQPAASSQPSEDGEHHEDAESSREDDEQSDPQASSTEPSSDQPEADSQYSSERNGNHGHGDGQNGGSDQQGVDAAASQPGDSSEWIVIFSGQQEFNLLDLRNGKTNLLASADIPVGDYSGMRLIVTQGTVTLKDGRVFSLKIPSGSQTGIKLRFNFTVEAGQEKTLLLDVNLSHAFKAIPEGHFKHAEEIKGFMFRPALGMRLINVLHVGSISGMVTDASQVPLANVTVTALRDGVEVVQTSTDATGTYKLVGLTAGTYQVAFSAEGYVDYQTGDITVAEDQVVENVDATLQAAAPATQP